MSTGPSSLSLMVDDMHRAIALDKQNHFPLAASAYQRTLVQLSDMIQSRDDELKRMRDFQTEHSSRLKTLLSHAGSGTLPPSLILPPPPVRTEPNDVVGQWETNAKLHTLPISHSHGKRKHQSHHRPRAPKATSISEPPVAAPPSAAADDAQTEEKRLTDMIQSDIIQPRPKYQWSGIQGMDSIKNELYRGVVMPILQPDRFVGLCEPHKGIVLYGPPGNGKTMIAKALAAESKATFFQISASTIGSKWHGESEKLVRKIFAMAVELAPSIIFLDEMEALLRQRSSDEHDVTRKVKTEFLVRMDGIPPQSRVVVIGATNLPGELDDAFKRRFTSSILIPAPSYESRLAIFKTVINSHKHKHALEEKDFIALAQTTEGFCASDIESFCRQAAMQHLLSDSTSDSVLHMTHFREIQSKIKPSLTPQRLAEYEVWGKKGGR